MFPQQGLLSFNPVQQFQQFQPVQQFQAIQTPRANKEAHKDKITEEIRNWKDGGVTPDCALSPRGKLTK